MRKNSIMEGAGADFAYPFQLGTKPGPAFQVENDGVSGLLERSAGIIMPGFKGIPR